jgi:hypothetical protein
MCQTSTRLKTKTRFKTRLKTAMTRLKSVFNASKLVFGFQN